MKNKMVSELISWVKALAIALIIVLVCRQFLITPSIVKGESMMPNLQDGDRIILSKISKIDRFDEIAFHAPDSKDNYVKRVIGLPGDQIQMNNDKLIINGKVYDEPYLNASKSQLPENQSFTYDFNLEDLTGETEVPEGKLFVLGDNRKLSKDSRIFGFISEESVIGDVKMRIWPLDSIEIIN
ncbi:signal peptidase I [Aquibacillus kalidii]|uniref:signal peptidase I n=1 Tax=Aquibacillus kalidii TaxID=2762597 RepID=UPI001648C5C6|nr:signal peptidase I [Aquibacillus kalidii]